MLFFNEHYQCNSICLKFLFSFSLSTLVMAKVMSSICVDLGAHSFIPTPHPLKHTFFSHDGVRLRDVCSTSDTIPGGNSHTLPIWVCAAQRGRDFEAPDLE